MPHPGFEVLRRLAQRAGRSFVFTSNVYGQFQRAGFPDDSIVECHGSIHHLQCLGGCGIGVFPADATVAVDPATFRARPPLPCCPRCGALARPNILMFGDGGWEDANGLSPWAPAIESAKAWPAPDEPWKLTSTHT